MDNISILEQETLEVLKQLELCCQTAQIEGADIANGIEVTFGDIDFSIFKGRAKNLIPIAQNLQKNGVEFILTFDMEEDPGQYVGPGQYPESSYVPLGKVDGRSIKIILEKIKKLIVKFNLKYAEGVRIRSDGGYSAYRPEIKLSSIGLKIRGPSIYDDATIKRNVFNATDEDLIYCLLDLYEKDEEACLSDKQLGEKLDRSPGTIKNSITNINKAVRGMGPGNTAFRFPFIKNKFFKGYHLNPQLVIKVTHTS